MTMTTMTRTDTVEGSRPDEDIDRSEKKEEEEASIARTDSWANLPPTW